jgi:hypothetical protein
VILRKVPGALALGLLASLGAHVALYGGEHSMGGGYHALLVQAAIAGILSLAVGLSALAWNALGATPDGTILAARLTDRIPGFAELGAAAALWFGLAEAIEPHHAGAAPLAIVLALAGVVWLVRRIAILAVAILARAVFAISRPGFSARTPSWARRRKTSPPSRPLFGARRRFARPPPTGLLHCA